MIKSENCILCRIIVFVCTRSVELKPIATNRNILIPARLSMEMEKINIAPFRQ